MMDTRRWGPGERLVFEPYTKEVYDETFKWIADRGIFADTGDGQRPLRGRGDPGLGGCRSYLSPLAARGRMAQRSGTRDSRQSALLELPPHPTLLTAGGEKGISLNPA